MRVQWLAHDVILWVGGDSRPVTAGDIFIMPEAEARDRQAAGQLIILPDEIDSDQAPAAPPEPVAVEAAPEPSPDTFEDVAETIEAGEPAIFEDRPRRRR